jgi:hypothetical protein
MSDLQIGLVGIGILVVVAVLAYNKWQEVKLRRRAEAAFASQHRDALLGERAGAAAAREVAARWTPAPPGEPVRRVEHTLGDAGHDAGGATQAEASPAAPAPTLDAAVDFIIEIDCPRPADAADLEQHGRGSLDETSVKPVHWEGRDDARGDWRPIEPAGRYRSLRVGLQLADRSGAVTEADLAVFARAVNEIAVALGARPRVPPIAEGLARAQGLDRFCADVDVLIGLSVIGSESHTFPGTKIRAAAESAGLVVGKDGRYHRFGEDGIEHFALANLEPMPFHPETMKTLQTRGVTALFEVPRVPASDTAFRRFLDFAHELEQALGGVLVDDNRKPIGQAAIESILQQLDRIHATMDERGIPAGGPVARRLFT